jgi:hypothetical protein
VAMATPDSPQDQGLALLARAGGRTTGTISGVANRVEPGVSWSPDSSAVAFCIRSREHQATRVVRVSPVRGTALPELRIVPPAEGRCAPAYTFDGRPATTDGRHVFVGRTRLPIGHLLEKLAGGGPLDVAVTAMAWSPDGLVVAVARRGPEEDGQAVLVTIRRDGQVIRTDHPPQGLIDAMGVSPDGAWLWLEYAISGATRLIPLNAPDGSVAVLGSARGMAFSPDSRFIAIAFPGELRIVDLSTGGSRSITDTDPVSVSWTA